MLQLPVVLEYGSANPYRNVHTGIRVGSALGFCCVMKHVNRYDGGSWIQSQFPNEYRLPTEYREFNLILEYIEYIYRYRFNIHYGVPHKKTVHGSWFIVYWTLLLRFHFILSCTIMFHIIYCDPFANEHDDEVRSSGTLSYVATESMNSIWSVTKQFQL